MSSSDVLEPITIQSKPPFSLSLYAHSREDYATSHFVHPIILLIYRFCCFCYVCFFNIRMIVVDGFSAFRFFTRINFFLLCIYLAFTTGISLYHLFKGRRSSKSLPTPFHMITWVIADLAFPSSLFLDVAFWALLWEEGDPIVLGSLHSHAINFFVILGEVMMNKLTFLHSHLLLLVEFGLGYLVFAWSWHYKTGEWIYGFLNVNRLIALAFYAAFIIGALACYYFWKLVTYLRDRAAKRWCRPSTERVALVLDRRNMQSPHVTSV